MRIPWIMAGVGILLFYSTPGLFYFTLTPPGGSSCPDAKGGLPCD
jgi:hypothetical protein